MRKDASAGNVATMDCTGGAIGLRTANRLRLIAVLTASTVVISWVRAQPPEGAAVTSPSEALTLTPQYAVEEAPTTSPDAEAEADRGAADADSAELAKKLSNPISNLI